MNKFKTIIKEPETDETSDGSTVSYDGRQARAKLLVKWLDILTYNIAINDYSSWFKSLNIIYYMCSPYVNTDQSIKVKEQLRKTSSVLNLFLKKRNISSRLIIRSLEDSTEITLSVFKDQFMQTQQGESDGFDPADFEGGED